MNFFEVNENDASYKDVCTRGSSNTNTNLKEAFAGLQCTGESLDDWEAESKQYIQRFKKAKQCMQRRITTMKKYNASTPASVEARKKHKQPILLAYAYGKNCARKLGTRKNVKRFEESTDRLLETVASVQPNVRNLFPDGINTSAKTRADLQMLLNKPYYTDEQWDAINAFRKDPENPDFHQAYNSILDANLEKKGIRRAENVGNVGNVADNENTKEKETFKPSRRRFTRRRPVVTKSAPLNLSNIPPPMTQEEEMERAKDSFEDITYQWQMYIQVCVILDLTINEQKHVNEYLAFIDLYKSHPTFASIRKQLNEISEKFIQHYNNQTENIQLISNQKNKLFHKLVQRMQSEDDDYKKYFEDSSKSGMFNIFSDLNKLIAMQMLRTPEEKNKLLLSIKKISNSNMGFIATMQFINNKLNVLHSEYDNHMAKIDKLKSMIEMKKYKRSNGGIGAQFFAKLDELEDKTSSVGNEYAALILDRLEKSLTKVNEFSRFLYEWKNDKVNFIVSQYVLNDLLKRVGNFKLHKPDTYAIKSTHIDKFIFPIDVEPVMYALNILGYLA